MFFGLFYVSLLECSSHFLGLGLFCKRPELQRDKSRNHQPRLIFGIQELDTSTVVQTKIALAKRQHTSVGRQPCGRGRSGMSAGAADDDELLSVADIIDEALAIIAATDEAPSTDDECTGQGQATALRAEARERRAGASRGSSGSGLASASHRARPTCRAPSTLGSRGQEHALRAAGAHVLLPRPRHDGRHADAGRGARAHNCAVERPQVAGRPRAALAPSPG